MCTSSCLPARTRRLTASCAARWTSTGTPHGSRSSRTSRTRCALSSATPSTARCASASACSFYTMPCAQRTHAHGLYVEADAIAQHLCSTRMRTVNQAPIGQYSCVVVPRAVRLARSTQLCGGAACCARWLVSADASVLVLLSMLMPVHSFNEAGAWCRFCQGVVSRRQSRWRSFDVRHPSHPSSAVLCATRSWTASPFPRAPASSSAPASCAPRPHDCTNTSPDNH